MSKVKRKWQRSILGVIIIGVLGGLSMRKMPYKKQTQQQQVICTQVPRGYMTYQEREKLGYGIVEHQENPQALKRALEMKSEIIMAVKAFMLEKYAIPVEISYLRAPFSFVGIVEVHWVAQGEYKLFGSVVYNLDKKLVAGGPIQEKWVLTVLEAVISAKYEETLQRISQQLQRMTPDLIPFPPQMLQHAEQNRAWAVVGISEGKLAEQTDFWLKIDELVSEYSAIYLVPNNVLMEFLDTDVYPLKIKISGLIKDCDLMPNEKIVENIYQQLDKEVGLAIFEHVGIYIGSNYQSIKGVYDYKYSSKNFSPKNIDESLPEPLSE